MRRRRALARSTVLRAVISFTAVGCRSHGGAPEASSSGAPSAAMEATTEATTEAAASPERRRIQPFSELSRCRIDHGGLFIDLGSEASFGRHGFSFAPPRELSVESFSDHSYTRFGGREAEYDFWLGEAATGLQLRVRAQAGSAAALSASVDQWRLGTLRVRSDGFRTLSFPALESSLGPGRHQLRLRWSGRGNGEAHSAGLVEWLQWARPGETPSAYRAPREQSLMLDVALGAAPRRSLVLETPASVSCPVQLAGEGELAFGVGALGEAAGVLQLLARRDGKPPELLLERHLGGLSGLARWEDVSVDLARLGSELVQLELRATGDSGSARIAVSTPELVHAAPPAPRTDAQIAVLVIASGLSRELLPPFEGTRRLRHLTRLAEASARFPEYRVQSTLAGAVVASLLSGVSPLEHRLQSPGARLPSNVPLLSDRIHENGGQSAFLTGVPQTRAAFGFERGWNRYTAFSPVHDIAAAAPIEQGRAWLEEGLQRDRQARRLLVIHVRGGHPPWDLSREEVAELEPHDYAGVLEARRGGIILANLRANSRPALRHLAPADWLRLRALELAALTKQDEALGSLMDLLQRDDVWDRTLFVFTGDVAAGDAPELPFGEGHALTEDRLLVPLWIKFPAGAFAGRTVPGLVTSRDITTTLSDALGLHAWAGSQGLDLGRAAAGDGAPAGQAIVALLGPEYATRWGAWLLRGVTPRTPSLCDLGVDPACANDVLDHTPLAAEALWRATFDAQHRARLPRGSADDPELAPLDKETSAAVQVWGD